MMKYFSNFFTSLPGVNFGDFKIYFDRDIRFFLFTAFS